MGAREVRQQNTGVLSSMADYSAIPQDVHASPGMRRYYIGVLNTKQQAMRLQASPPSVGLRSVHAGRALARAPAMSDSRLRVLKAPFSMSMSPSRTAGPVPGGRSPRPPHHPLPIAPTHGSRRRQGEVAYVNPGGQHLPLQYAPPARG